MNKTIKRITILVMSAALVLSSCMTAFADAFSREELAKINDAKHVRVDEKGIVITDEKDRYFDNPDASNFPSDVETHIDVTNVGGTEAVTVMGSNPSTGVNITVGDVNATTQGAAGDKTARGIYVTNASVEAGEVTVQGTNAEYTVGIDITNSEVEAGNINVSGTKTETVMGVMTSEISKVKVGNVTVSGDSSVSEVDGITVVGATAPTKEIIEVETKTVTATSNGGEIAIGAVIEKGKADAAELYVDGDLIGQVNGSGLAAGLAVAGDEATVAVMGTLAGDTYDLILITDVGDSFYNTGVYVGEMKTGKVGIGSFGDLMTGNCTDCDESVSRRIINYIIKDSDNSATYKNMTITGCETMTTPDGKTYFTSKEGTVKVTVAAGYKLTSTTDITASGNTYIVTIPKGGGVTLEAVLEAVEKEEQKKERATGGGAWTAAPVNTGSPAAPITNGTWNTVNGQTRYVVNGEALKNTKAWITFVPAGQTQPVTGCFYFDNSGNMAIGWQKIDGLWYYFDAVNAPTLGMLYVDRITPDGYRVDANGVWIQ